MSVSFSYINYLISAVLFILSIKGLSSAKTSRLGNVFGIAGMAIAIITTFASFSGNGHSAIFMTIIIGGLIGVAISKNIQMTALPQLVAAFHSLVGLSAVLVAASAIYHPEIFHILHGDSIKLVSLVETGIGTIIGGITFTGSIIACLKLQGLIKDSKIIPFDLHSANILISIAIGVLFLIFMMSGSYSVFWLLVIGSFVLGITLLMPVGGADMPVLVSMLNSYSGWAACGIGFTINNHLLIITGALVGSSGAILSYIMCKGMNRSIFNVISGGMTGQGDALSAAASPNDRPVNIGSPDDAAFIMKQAQSIIIVPGYGMAVAQSQHALREMADFLKQSNINVRYAIHPVAGRMPGHMNVLLAEANVPYEDVLELDEINNDFGNTDVAFIIGANDITNPAAKNDPKSSIYGMPILDVDKAGTVFFVKRSMASGYAGIDNELFYNKNTYMVLGDAKKVCEAIIKALKNI